MPNREKVVDRLVNREVGGHAWNTLRFPPAHVCQNAPDCGLPGDRHLAHEAMAAARARADETFCLVMEAMDWNRVLSIAGARHDVLRERDGDAHPSGPYSLIQGDHFPPVCGECVKEAAMSIEPFAFGFDNDAAEKAPRARPVEEFL